jgi:hypothetical protein
MSARDGADEADDRRFVGKYPHHVGSALDLLVNSLQRVEQTGEC